MARVKVSGDFAKKMDRWAELLRTSSVIVENASKAQAELTLTLIGEGFDQGRSPYGHKWRKKQTDDGRKVLHGETTRLRNGWHIVTTDKDGFRVAPSVEYAAYHQAPRDNSRPARIQVPTREKGLPKKWSEEFEAVALAEVAEHFDEAAGGSPAARPAKTKKAPTPVKSSAGSSKAARKGRASSLSRPSSRTSSSSSSSSASSSSSTGSAPVKGKGKRRGGIRTLGGFLRRIQQIRALAKKAGVE